MSEDEAPNQRVVERIAAKVRERREVLDLDQDLARYGGPSRSTVSILENKNVWPLRARTRSSWATALGWEPDAFERMVRGEEPVPLVKEESDPESATGHGGSEGWPAWLEDWLTAELAALRREIRAIGQRVEALAAGRQRAESSK